MSGLSPPLSPFGYLPGFTSAPAYPGPLTPTPTDTGQGVRGIAFDMPSPLMPVDTVRGRGQAIFGALDPLTEPQVWHDQMTNLVSLRGHGVYLYAGTVMQQLDQYKKKHGDAS